MLFSKIAVFAFAVVCNAAALPLSEALVAKFGVPAADVNVLLSAPDVSSLDITKYAKALKVDAKDLASWPESTKVAALEDLKERVQTYADESRSGVAKRQESNRQKVEKEVEGLIQNYRSEHNSDHGRRLIGCPGGRCTACAVALTTAYVAGLTTCGAAAVTEEAISAGTLTALAVTQLGACVTLVHSTYAGGWTFCLGMTG
ncbi:hypothetical protein FZEAL_6252 [Fusarium zealandicum]|uniref:Uncharacterized protein n=1 Tax=Fusarium zealandicum TaxID=1053134 RepID=A0A8H4UIM9_9HYPO|nr:hypothetical protein FZEAL_6252 [Fusarium zealandicum]